MNKSTAEQEIKTIFVTIGHRFSTIPMANKVAILVFEDETETKVAKKFRKKLADKPQFHGYSSNTKSFKPSELYWAIFDSPKEDKPRIKSDNYNPGSLVSVNSFQFSQ
jgi:hypothetical protein